MSEYGPRHKRTILSFEKFTFAKHNSINLRELIAIHTSVFNDVIPVLFHKAHMLFSAVNVLLLSCLKIDQEVKHSMEIQKCLLPLKKSAQCTDVQSKLHSIWEQNDFKTNLLQLSSFPNLSSELSQKPE